MITQILKRFYRAPAAALGVILLAAVLSASLCALHAANVAEQARYDDTIENMEVKIIVTNLSGTRSDDLDAPSWVEKFFTSRLTTNGIFEYVKDVQVQYTMTLNFVEFLSEGASLHGIEGEVVGISNISLAPEISGGGIKWVPGYDASIFQSGQNYCVVPESIMPEEWDGNSVIQIMAHCSVEGTWGMESIRPQMLIVGTQSVSPGRVYCSNSFLKIHSPGVDRIQATLIDNSMIETVRELSKTWFAEPNPTGEKTPWDYSYYFWYPYALKIDTDQMVLAERTLKISIMINELCAVLVFALSAGASFFVGFLMIRSRKREISQMRTLGTRPTAIFISFALEQLLCLAGGIALGGLAFGFQPQERLGAFAAVYFTGLCVALVLFLRKNLMTTLKEDE